MEVRWVRRALHNLDEEIEFIARNDRKAAVETFEQIRTSVDRLRIFPAMGRVGRVAGTRELIIAGTPYIVPYRLREDEIEVLRVIHSARKWPTRL